MFADIGSNPIGSDIGESLDPGRIRQIDDIGSEEGSDLTIVLFENFRFRPAPEGKWGRNTAVCMGIPTRLAGQCVGPRRTPPRRPGRTSRVQELDQAGGFAALA